MPKNSVADMKDLIRSVIEDEADSLIDSNPNASIEKIKGWIEESHGDLLDGIYPVYTSDRIALMMDAINNYHSDYAGMKFDEAVRSMPEAIDSATFAIVDHLWNEVLNEFEPEMPEEEEEPAPKKKRK